MNSVRKKSIIGGIILAAIIGLVATGAQINPEYTKESSDSVVWQTRIAGPEFDNVSTHKMGLGNLEGRTYKVEFVPMGDSPSKIRIDIKGKWTERYYMDPSWRPLFSEEFVLKGTPVDTGLSKYYTWEYVGQKYVYIPEVEGEANYEISISRSGKLKGSVTISLSR